MSKHTLRKYLLEERAELYEEVLRLKDKKLSDEFTEADTIALEVAQAKLNVIKDIIYICTIRNHY